MHVIMTKIMYTQPSESCNVLEEPAWSLQSCRNYVTACSFYKYAPNVPISAPDKLLLSYLSSWQLFNLEIFSYPLSWGPGKT